MLDFLESLLETTAADLDERKRRFPAESLRQAIAAGGGTGNTGAGGDTAEGGGSFSRALAREGISVIAEFKRASPSKGDIRPDADIAAVAAAYERAGVSAMSVLTEERHFRGSLDDLRAARRACGLPLLRKDFIIDGYQLLEAAAAGADAVLLIAAALDDDRLAGLQRDAEAVGLECLVEVHDRNELERALETAPAIIGINNRDLRTFDVDLGRSLNLIELVPDDVIVVGESGISDRKDVSRLAEAGFDAILVGETLMRAPDPGRKIDELLSFH